MDSTRDLSGVARASVLTVSVAPFTAEFTHSTAETRLVLLRITVISIIIYTTQHHHLQSPASSSTVTSIIIYTTHSQSIRVTTLSPTKKPKTFPELSRIPKKNFPGPFRSPRMFKYKEKNGIYLQYSEYSPSQKIQQNVDTLGDILLLLVFHLKQ